MIEIALYNPLWSARFEQIAARLRSGLGDLVVRIDHIGSTSVPGLDAKNIIDVQITVRRFDDELTAAFAAMGCDLAVENTRDHRPPGASGPESDWEKRFFHTAPELRPAHLHVRIQGRPNQRYPLLFRDYLRSHPAAAAGYGELKRRLARFHSDDWRVYSEIKDPVCDIIMAAAEDWARETGWMPE